jgi:hypothetical protein
MQRYQRVAQTDVPAGRSGPAAGIARFAIGSVVFTVGMAGLVWPSLGGDAQAENSIAPFPRVSASRSI